MGEIMDKDALQQLQQAETLKLINGALEKTKVDFPCVALPDGFSVKSLEDKFENRFSYRGTFKTSDADSFIKYILAQFKDGAKCFVSPDDMSAKCILNIGTDAAPGHCNHTSILKLVPTSEYKTVLNFNESRVNQKTLAEFFEDWREYLTPYNSAGEVLPMAKAVSGIRKITIDTERSLESNVQDFSESKSAMERMEARSSDGIPAGFIFECQPYTCLAPYRFDFRLSIITSGDKVELSVRIKMLEKLQEAMTKEFANLISSELGNSDIGIFIGEGNF